MTSFSFTAILLAFLQAGISSDLKESLKQDDCQKITLEMSLKGEMRVQREAKNISIPMTGSAKHIFAEKALHINSHGLPDKVARNYQQAEATFKIDGNTASRKLRQDRSLCVVQKPESKLFLYSPLGALTREELELTSEHFDTLALGRLLPGKDLKPGETWPIQDAAVQAICNFEGLESHTLIGTVTATDNDESAFKITGKASGIESGAQVKCTISATGKFSLKNSLITSVTWNQTDEREQGPINPASKTEMTLELKRESIETTKELSDSALVSVPEGFQVPGLMSYLEYRDNSSRFELTLNRDWQVVAKTDNHLVLRLVEKGDFVAQATLSVWSKSTPGQHLSIQELKAIIDRTPGWATEKELQEGEVPTEEKGRFVYRISLLGQLENMPTIQNYFLVAAPSGEQMLVTFSLNPKQAEKLGTKDLSLIGSLELPASKGK